MSRLTTTHNLLFQARVDVFGCLGFGLVDRALCSCRTSDFVVRSRYEREKFESSLLSLLQSEGSNGPQKVLNKLDEVSLRFIRDIISYKYLPINISSLLLTFLDSVPKSDQPRHGFGESVSPNGHFEDSLSLNIHRNSLTLIIA